MASDTAQMAQKPRIDSIEDRLRAAVLAAAERKLRAARRA